MGTEESAGEEALTEDQRTQLRRAHQRLRTASKELEVLVSTEPLKKRWEPEPAPPEILAAARDELHQAYDALVEVQRELLGWDRPAPA